jgi:hypothetical protein
MVFGGALSARTPVTVDNPGYSGQIVQSVSKSSMTSLIAGRVLAIPSIVSKAVSA